MTAEGWAAHLAAVEHVGPAAVRAHLAFEHLVGCAVLGLDPLDVPLPFAVHLLVHQNDPEPAFPTKGTP